MFVNNVVDNWPRVRTLKTIIHSVEEVRRLIHCCLLSQRHQKENPGVTVLKHKGKVMAAVNEVRSNEPVTLPRKMEHKHTMYRV